jgi:hypothetical protein
VGEAIVTRRRTTTEFTRKDLQGHIEKLFAYATCPVYFHITYEMSGDEVGVLEYLREISREISIDGIAFVTHEEIKFVDSAPRGFSAVYSTGAGERIVHFLVLDLHQGVQKTAAKAAAASNPRK